MVSLPITAGAVDIYSTTPEAEPLFKNSPLMSMYSSGISTAAVEPSDLSTYLSAVYNGYSHTVAQLLATLNTSVNQFFKGSGSIPNGVGGTISGSNVSLWQLNNAGFQGVTYVLTQIRSYVSNLSDYSTVLNSILTSVNNVVSGLSTVNTSVGAVNTSVGVVNSSVLSLSPSLVQIRDRLHVAGGGSILGSNGISVGTSSNQSISNALSKGLLGLSANIKGSETDNVYTSTLYDNNNSSTSVNSTGLGPLLNNQLSNIGENLGHLAYVFANDEDIKLREDSQPLLNSTDSFYDDSDSNVKVSANNVGSLKDIAGNFTSIINTDADIGDAFAIVSNSNTFRWFSADTAMNLDSLGVATVDYEESTFDRLHREFNEIYFPDRVGGAS